MFAQLVGNLEHSHQAGVKSDECQRPVAGRAAVFRERALDFWHRQVTPSVLGDALEAVAMVPDDQDALLRRVFCCRPLEEVAQRGGIAHVQLVAPAGTDVAEGTLLQTLTQHPVGAAVIFTILVDQYHHFAIPVRADHLHLEQVVGRFFGERVVARHVDVETPLRQRLLAAH